MNKIYLTLIAIFAISHFSYAQTQWTTSGSNIYNSNTGNVGIGTTTPAATLDINGAMAAKGMVINDTQTIQVPSDGTYVIASGARVKGSYTLTFEGSSRVQTVTLVANGVQFDYNSTLTILGNTSYAGSVIMSNFRFLFSPDNTIVYLVFDVSNRNGGTYVTAHFNGTGAYNPYWGGILPASPVGSGIFPLVINGGNVLIGENSQKNSAYKLDVAGNIRANQITVNTTGADFVFDPSYRLDSLDALKQYIAKNHHLPEIPSAVEMQKDGLNVGDNQIKLLQKVEELTLYLIDKDKALKDEQVKNNQQERKLISQQAQIDQLQQQLNTLVKSLDQK